MLIDKNINAHFDFYLAVTFHKLEDQLLQITYLPAITETLHFDSSHSFSIMSSVFIPDHKWVLSKARDFNKYVLAKVISYYDSEEKTHY